MSRRRRGHSASMRTSASATGRPAPSGRRPRRAGRSRSRRTAETRRFTCGFLFLGSGYYDYDQGYRPHGRARQTYRGRFVHPQLWPEDLDYSGKRIVVIGSGATAVTLVPALAETAAHVTMLQRSPSYIVARPSRGRDRALAAAPAARQGGGRRDPLEERPARHVLLLARPQEAGAGAGDLLLKWVAEQLPRLRHRAGFHAALQSLGPARLPGARRRPVQGDQRRARSSVVTDGIERFTETGIRLASGAELEADIVVTATGLVVKLLGGIALERRRRAGQRRRAAQLQGHDAERRAQSGAVLRLHQRLLDAEMRPHLALCLPAAQPYGPAQARHLRRRGCPRAASSASRCSISARAMSAAPRAACRGRAPKPPWRVHQNYLKDLAALRLRHGDRRGDGVSEGRLTPQSGARHLTLT